jgi:pimeloyl-ACP methyl ester carboxylesterase
MHAVASTGEPAEARPAVFVHGIGVASPYMVPTVARLGPHHRSYAVDLPGFGQSDKPRRTLGVEELADALAGWLAAVGIEHPAVVGNSFGCQVVVDLAVRHPERVGRLALLGPTTDPAARTAARQVARWLRTSLHERPSQLPLLLRDYARAGPRRPLQTFRFALRDRVEEKLPRVQAPTLVVRGEKDSIVPQRWAEEIVRLLPRGRLAVIAGAAHAVNYSSPDEVARLLRSFLRERP